MNVVQPIRDKIKLEDLKYELKKTGIRKYLMFLTGLNSGIRVSDVVNRMQVIVQIEKWIQ